jgi:DNA-binding response OmpR family regulator
MINVLIVDPFQIYSELLARQTHLIDYSFDYAISGFGAIEQLKKQNYDLIIVARQLADMQGEELSKKAQPFIAQDCALILLTSSSDNIAPDTLKYFLAVFNKKEINELVNFLTHYQAHQQKIYGRVLYVEDSVSQRELLTAEMEKWGLQIKAFENADSAWQALARNHFDVVIIDIHLSGSMSGTQFVNKIRRLDAPKGLLPILAITAFDSLESRTQLFKLGINDYVIKPALNCELRARIKNLISQYFTQLCNQSLLKLQNHSSITFNDALKVIDCNDKFTALLGYDKEAVINKHLGLIFPEAQQIIADQNKNPDTYNDSTTTPQQKFLALKNDGESLSVLLKVHETYIDGYHVFIAIIIEGE